ncbi:hypothetical protein P280DRAFT_473099 [Massarina eburnea CBS 473.64]|uniref:Uncharacterized protein n=1 Tax=Massarina eburnea CBS 473.64 TaxID=1395130 RepID=A0A6A6RMR0_9PLEO|nr:hypothetical protein P280DRAFT_473099 [Massarina eburnea CBS 473.64]
MAAFEVYRFHDSYNNTIKYLFNPSKRQTTKDSEEPFGPVVLDEVIETFDPEFDEVPSTPITEPTPGTEFFRYTARDGADVRYQYDRTARNGKNYIIAIHRDPENWKTLSQEDLAVDDEEVLRRRFDWTTETTGLKRKDSVTDLSEPEVNV